MIRVSAVILSVLLTLLIAGPAPAAPTTVTLDGFVTESSDAAYTPGDPLQLTLNYSSNFVSWWYGVASVPSDGLVQAGLVAGDPIGEFAGMWSLAEFVCFNVITGNDLNGPCQPDDPFHGWRLDAAFDASNGPLQLLFSGELIWGSAALPPIDLDGTEFLQRFEGGGIELRRDGATVLRGQLVPEPSTALLLAGGLLALGLCRRRSG
jgi:hypothetical protein